MAVLTATVGLALSMSACSHDSYLKITLLGADGAFVDVSRIVVHVRSENGTSAWLQYPLAKTVSFDTMTGKTFSISFTPSQSGPVQLDVGILNQASLCLGRGATPAIIKKGDVSSIVVLINQATQCPTADDAGAPDGRPDATSDGVTFAGCDPANPGAMCGSNQTCFVNCASSRGMCIAAGNKGPGEACATNTDCMPGTQCFDYSGLPGCGAGTKICQKFCSGDSQCSAPTSSGTGGIAGMPGTGGAAARDAEASVGDGGVGGAGGGGGGGSAGGDGTAGGNTGTGDNASGGSGAGGGAGNGTAGNAGTAGIAGSAGSASTPTSSGGTGVPPAGIGQASCRNPVVCSVNLTTSYRTCSFACDPRGEATLGCPKGLMCFLYRDTATGLDSPDCGCRDPSRTRTDGMACATSADCIPGYVCNMMSGTQVCRKLCKVGAATTDCPAAKSCSPLTNTAFGVCVGG